MPTSAIVIYMSKKVLITGVSGFVGNHLTREFKSNGYVVDGVSREDTGPSDIHTYIKADLADPKSFDGIDITQYVGIVHLAGLAAVGPSFDNPRLYIDINAAVTISLLEAAMKCAFSGRIVVVSSGALYSPKQAMPITEESDIALNSPYAVSKVTVEKLCEYYQGRGLDIIVARPFNHIGPAQLPGFILPDLHQQLIQSKNSNKPLPVGNLQTRRDYTDVRDVARAYRLLIESKSLRHTIYNICSGSSYSGQEILDALIEAHNLGKSDVKTKVDKSKIRPNDAPEIVGSNSRIKADTGWQPIIKLQKTVSDFVAEA